jgi:hypothetical protein
MPDDPARIAALLRERAPHAYCCACLATALGLTESAALNAVQRLLMGPGYRLVRRPCDRCERTATVVGLA